MSLPNSSQSVINGEKNYRCYVHTVGDISSWAPILKGFLFCPFKAPSKSKDDTNEISFESPDIGLLEFKKKLGVASF